MGHLEGCRWEGGVEGTLYKRNLATQDGASWCKETEKM